MIAARRGFVGFPGARDAAAANYPAAFVTAGGGGARKILDAKAVAKVAKLAKMAAKASGSNSGGGWDVRPAELVGPGLGALDLDRCDVDELPHPGPSPENFLRQYVLPGRPLVIRGGSIHW